MFALALVGRRCGRARRQSPEGGGHTGSAPTEAAYNFIFINIVIITLEIVFWLFLVGSQTDWKAPGKRDGSIPIHDVHSAE